MEKKHDESRRKFIRNTLLTGGGTLLSSVFPFELQAGNVTGTIGDENISEETDVLLKEVSDIHLHCAPDSKARLTDELTFVREAKRAGYKYLMFKSNDFSCHDRAFLIRQSIPDFEVFGSICMNRVHGERVNVFAAEKAVGTTGHLCRCIWMPTQDAVYQNIRYHNSKTGIPVLDESGRVLPEVIRVMEICAEYDIIFATGHSSPEESIVMAEKAREVGVGKFVVTHANSGIWEMTHDQIKRCIDTGAWIEYSYITNLWGPGTGLPDFIRMSDQKFAEFAAISPERSFITTDLGQVGMTHPIEGMRKCISGLIENGMSREDIDTLVRRNPAKLIENNN